MSHGWREGTPWVAELTPRPDDRLHWLDRGAARRDVIPPGSLWTQPVATRWRSPESTNRKQFHVKCLPARPASAFAANADEQPDLYRPPAPTGSEWTHGSCRRHAQCHAPTPPPYLG